ncbi:amidohydrolase [Pseudoclavibacter endophyticus]|uniref:Amidohydrolase n=1 Tax=Pseudoclavibacter endophyticus TaxID=1778590 RepID=A0A6H9WSQ2_9MICO|nr:amidohydrolase [Pseudoclavibacter endophyticus]KAB1649384.1 amidohydrolase [Pseudoclavibacter endophyticus]GGA63061.1 amidohydrolase [Pseudoclavibacter endophyticus]
MTTTENHADLVFHGGRVLTLAGEFAPREAIAIRGGVVQAVGDDRDVRSLVGPRTEVIDLGGSTVIPGINDGHLHPVGIGTFRPPFTLSIGKEQVSSIADIRDVVARAVRDKAPGEWIRGFGWDVGYLAEGRTPSREDLDDIAPDHPVVLTQWSGHAAWVNSKALEIAGIGRDTAPPAGGEIVKDGRGEPTGILLEGAAWMMNAAIPPFTDAERREALVLATTMMRSEGITSFTDAGLDLGSIELYREAYAAGDIRQRGTLMVMASQVGDLREALLTVTATMKDAGVDPRFLTVDQVKIAADGVPTQARTAWMSEPYVGGGTGGPILPGETEAEQLATFREWVLTAHELGFQVGTHATGDRAIDVTVEMYEHAVAQLGDRGLRHYVIHSDFASPATLARMAAAGFGASFNPNIKRSTAHQLMDVVGRERIDYEWPYRTALHAGVVVASSSDAPVVHPSFREGIHTMLTRTSAVTGEVFGPGERIGLEEALRTYTVAGAHQDRAEDWKGTLAEGMAADLVVLGGDLLSLTPDEILDVPIEQTVIGGEIVYDAASAS